MTDTLETCIPPKRPGGQFYRKTIQITTTAATSATDNQIVSRRSGGVSAVSTTLVDVLSVSSATRTASGGAVRKLTTTRIALQSAKSSAAKCRKLMLAS